MADFDVTELEASLRNFVIDSLGSGEQSFIGKCRGLKLLLDFTDRNRPAFTVQIGCMESLFDISNCVKLSGALSGGIDRIVPKWFMRVSAKEKFYFLLKNYINNNKEIKSDEDIEY